MNNYYSENLNAQKLYKVYDTKIPRVKQYLNEEINFIIKNISKYHNILELGSGYGRIIKELAPYCNSIIGIDISKDNVLFGKEYTKHNDNAKIIEMDINNMHFNNSFDTILCLQNGLSSMQITNNTISKILKMLNPGGIAFFSSYSDKFWNIRLKWFEEQMNKGLLGKIDYTKTKDGTIICKDGFVGTTYTQDDLDKIGKSSGYPYYIKEIDNSSVFLIINKKE